MKYFILATAAAIMLSGTAVAKVRGTAQDGHLAGAKNVIRERGAGTAIQIAMGPTSAAHYPINQPPGNPPPQCMPSSDQCPKSHWKPKHRRHRKPSGQRSQLPFAAKARPT